MPARYPPYPYYEVISFGATTEQIMLCSDELAQHIGYRAGASIEEICHASGIEIEYSGEPNEVLLDARPGAQPIVWLPRNGRRKDDRLAVCTALGHCTLHLERTRDQHPGCGVQALYNPVDAGARYEARLFGFNLLMPPDAFRNAWYEGRATAAAEFFDVPTSTAYERATDLNLT